MRSSLAIIIRSISFLFVLIAAGCSSGGGSSAPPDCAQTSAGCILPESLGEFSIGGQVSGLSGAGLVLRNNDGDDLAITQDGPFAFPTKLTKNTSYNVAVATQPLSPAQTCKVQNGSGTVTSSNNTAINSVSIICATNTYTVGGTIAGLAGSGLVLKLNGGDARNISTDGDFTFATVITSGSSYQVTIESQPSNPAQSCALKTGTGSGTVTDYNITLVAIDCATIPTLDAIPLPRSVVLTWDDVGATSYNLYQSTAPNCDVGIYSNCAGGTAQFDVSSPLTLTLLSNGLPYYFQLEATKGAARAVSSIAGARPDQLVTNGTVRAITLSGDEKTVYLGGDFTQIGARSGGGVPIDLKKGRVVAPDFPIVAGIVNAAAPDGAGGWYIGGSFTNVGTFKRKYLAHIRADRTVDSQWIPTTNGEVRTLAVSGDTVYVGGAFTSFGGQTRNYLAAIGSDGSLLSWNPDANDQVYTITISGDTVFVGGNFTSMGTVTRNRLAAVGIAGSLLPWNPDSNGSVRCLVVANDTVYAGGAFTTVGGSMRNRLAAIGKLSGAVLSWNPDASYGPVNTIAVSRDTIYVGGIFTTVGGLSRSGVAAIDVAGAPTAWNPGVTPLPYKDPEVNTLAISGSTVFVGGRFDRISNQPRGNLAAIAMDGSLQSWDPHMNGNVNTTVIVGSTMFAGGGFASVGSQTRNRVAAVGSDGSLLPWSPNVSGSYSPGITYVNTVAVANGNVYIGGEFLNVNGETRYGMGAISEDGTLQANPKVDGFEPTVYAFATSGNTVYLGGNIYKIGTQTRYHVGAVDNTGLATTWYPSMTSSNRVYSLAATAATVFVSGQFTSIGGQTHTNFAATSAVDGSVYAWNLDTSGVSTMAIGGSTLFAGGGFNSVGGQARDRLAAINTTDGSVLPWNPTANNQVRSVAVAGSTVYVGGNFTSVGGQPRNYLAAVGTDGTLSTAWNPGANGPTYAIAAPSSSSSTVVYVGGSFSEVNGESAGNFAVIPK